MNSNSGARRAPIIVGLIREELAVLGVPDEEIGLVRARSNARGEEFVDLCLRVDSADRLLAALSGRRASCPDPEPTS